VAKKKAPAKSGEKSSAIRQILSERPNASTADIKSQLDEQGISASIALINKIRSDRKGGAAAKKRRKKGVSKADAIRQKFDQLGLDARPRDIIAALKSEGVKVTSAQVSMLRAKLSSGGTSNGKARSQSVSSVSFDHLVAAKRLAEQLGGIENARRALESYARLITS
jgi:lambda repressor-like predicted transcriptional regulator